MVDRDRALYDLSRACAVGLSQLVQERPEYLADDIRQMLVALSTHAPDVLHETDNEGNLTADLLAWCDDAGRGDESKDSLLSGVCQSLRTWLDAHS